MKSLPLALAVALGSVSLFSVAACSDDSAPAANGTSTSSSSGSTSSSSSSGATPPAPPLEPVETVSCPDATAAAACAMPDDVNGFGPDDLALTTDASCKTSLYVVGQAEGQTERVARRYTLKSIAPCAFERDTTFGEPASGKLIGADDAGNAVLTVTDRSGRLLLKDGSTYPCDGISPADLDAVALTVARDGRTAYVGYEGTQGDGKLRAMGKITITGGTCSGDIIELTEPLTGVRGLALDTHGRLHVSDDAKFAAGAARVAIFDADGKFLSSYKATADDSFFSPSSITACKGGICVDGFASVHAYDESGNVKASAKLQPLEALAGLIKYLGTPRGPFFLAGGSNDDPRRIVVSAQKQPAK